MLSFSQEAVIAVALSLSIASATLSIIALLHLAKLRKRGDLLMKISREFEKRGKPGKLRKRYIVFRVISDGKVLRSQVEEAIRAAVKELYGVTIVSIADPQLIAYDDELMKGIIRTNNLAKDYVIASMSIVREASGRRIIVKPIKTTGLLRKARKYMEAITR
ncbi:MAG: Rpp14/Pop5 family protein [Desulfurococcaceae archaeon]